MEIYSIKSEKTFSVRKMTIEERNREFGERRSYIIGCDRLTEDEMIERINDVEERFMKYDCFIHKNPGCIALFFLSVIK